MKILREETSSSCKFCSKALILLFIATSVILPVFRPVNSLWIFRGYSESIGQKTGKFHLCAVLQPLQCQWPPNSTISTTTNATYTSCCDAQAQISLIGRILCPFCEFQFLGWFKTVWSFGPQFVSLCEMHLVKNSVFYLSGTWKPVCSPNDQTWVHKS